MNAIQYWAMKVRYRLAGRKKEIVSDYFRKMGMTIGKGCNICDNITTTQAYLITLGDNVTLAGGGTFCGPRQQREQDDTQHDRPVWTYYYR